MSPVGLHITIMRKRNHIKSCSGGTRRAQWRCHGHFWHLSTISKVAIITIITINIINIHQHPSTWTPSPTSTQHLSSININNNFGHLHFQQGFNDHCKSLQSMFGSRRKLFREVYSYISSKHCISKHLKDQLGPPVSDVTFFGPKEVSWDPP